MKYSELLSMVMEKTSPSGRITEGGIKKLKLPDLTVDELITLASNSPICGGFCGSTHRLRLTPMKQSGLTQVEFNLNSSCIQVLNSRINRRILTDGAVVTKLRFNVSDKAGSPATAFASIQLDEASAEGIRAGVKARRDSLDAIPIGKLAEFAQRQLLNKKMRGFFSWKDLTHIRATTSAEGKGKREILESIVSLASSETTVESLELSKQIEISLSSLEEKEKAKSKAAKEKAAKSKAAKSKAAKAKAAKAKAAKAKAAKSKAA